MEIKLTDKQYKKLTELLYFSDLFLDSPSKLFSDEEVEEYEKLLKYIYSYSNSDIQIASINGILGKTPLSEEELDKVKNIFDIQLRKLFYHYLAEKFVEKEFPNTKVINEMSDTSALSIRNFISEEMQKYIEEFKENDLENIRFKFLKKPHRND